MKNNYIKILVTLLLGFCHNAMAQLQWFGPVTELDNAKLMVTYRLTYREDTTNLEKFGCERMVLIIGNTISNFQSYNKYESDRIGRQKQNEGILLEWVQSGAAQDYACRYQYSIYKNHPNGKITTTDIIFLGDSYEYEENLYTYSWKVVDDTASISGYSCQKAICDFSGRTWEAWFSEELPFNDGPYKFGGLPGLILNIADTQGHYVFEFLSIEKMPEGSKIGKEENDYIKTTKQRFFDAMRIYLKEGGYTDKVNEDFAKKIQAVMKSRNNPIELDRK